MKRLLIGCWCLVLANLAWGAEDEMTIFRSPTCGCCHKWAEYVKSNGFNIKDIIHDDMQAIKEKYGVPEKLASCHTAIVGGMIVEGHVPVSDIRTMLAEKGDLKGVSAPGMPLGSPGMEVPGNEKDPYQIISFDKKANFKVYSVH